MSNSLWPHGLQYTRLACPSLSTWIAQTHVHCELVMLSNNLILCCHLLLLPSIFPSIRIFSIEPVLCIKWPKYWSFSFSISSSSEYSVLISFRINWFDLFAVWGTLKSSPTPQFESINSSSLSHLWASLVAQLIKNLPAVWETGFDPWVGKIS